MSGGRTPGPSGGPTVRSARQRRGGAPSRETSAGPWRTMRPQMRLSFTKMHGAGNDFVVLDGTRIPVELSAAQAQRLADRRFGVGADQILVV